MKLLTIAEIAKFSAAATVKQLVENVAAESRAFILTAKLARHLETKLLEGETLGGVLRAKGVRKGTIDNARYAMRIIDELVVPGHMPESTFDTLGFRDCFRIANVMSSRSKMKLEAADIAVVLKKSPKNWDAELDSIFEHGMTIAEKKAADAEAAKSAPAPEPSGETEETEHSEAVSTEATPSTPEADSSTTSEPDPGKVVQMPAQATAETANALIDHLEAVLCELSPEELDKLRDRLLAFAETTTKLFAAEPKKKKLKKAA